MSRVPNPRAFGMARELAKPVAHGWLSPDQADAILIGSAYRSGVADPDRLAAFLQWIMRRHLHTECAQRDITAANVRWAVRPLIAQRADSRAILIEAERENDRAGLPLAADELVAIAAAEIDRAVQAMRWGHHNGR